MALIDNVILNNEDVLVIGGPSSVTLSLDFGKQGSRGTKIFADDSTPTAYFTEEVNQSLDIQLYDMFLNTLTNDLYQYVNTEPYSWTLIGNLEGTGTQGDPGPTGPAGAGVATGGTAGQILVKLSGTNYDTGWIDNYATSTKHLVKNSTGATMPKGSVVYISGATGTNMLVSLADADTEMTSSKTVGFLETNLDQGDEGYVITSGLLAGLNTSGAASEGQAIWLSTTAGQFVYGSPPAEPAHSVYLGVVTRKQNVNGEIFIHVSNGWELDEIHGVSVPSPVANDLLYYDATGLWKNSSIADLGIVKTGSTTNKVTNAMIDSTAKITVGSTDILLNGTGTNASLAGLTNVTATGTVQGASVTATGTVQGANLTATAGGTTTTPSLRVTNGSAGTIATPTGFLLGSTSTFGLVIDPDSIQAAQNSAASALFINPEGGNVTVASAGTTTTFPGIVDITGTIANGNVIAAGTATAGTAPLQFQSGTNLTVPVAGAVEYDGTAFYATPMTTGGRAITQNSYEYVQNTARTVTTPGATVTGIFGTGTTTTGVGLTLPAGTYEFEMHISESMTETATSHTLNLLFPCTGGTYGHINYSVVTATTTANSPAAAIFTNVTVATTATITGAATTAATVVRGIYARGHFRLTAGGAWTPQLQFSVAGGVSGNLTINAGSFVKVTPVSTNTATNISQGAWA